MNLNSFLQRYKPAAGMRTHLAAAAGMWTLVGLGLGLAGAIWAFRAPLPWSFLLILGGVGLGFLKGRWVLGRVAGRNADRLLRRGEGRCFFSFISWGSWGLALGMMALGWLLRHSGLPRPYIGGLYAAIGSALLTGSLPLWRAWRTAGLRQDL